MRYYKEIKGKQWNYMVTLTIDPKRYNTNDPLVISRLVNTFRKNLNERCGCEYDFILFPDFATDEQGIHLHGLCRCYEFENFLTDSGLRSKYGIIYNVHKWSYGYSTAIRLDGSSAVVHYCTKYFNKQGTWINKLLPKHFYRFGKVPKADWEYKQLTI
jgi:hypothetical protein